MQCSCTVLFFTVHRQQRHLAAPSYVVAAQKHRTAYMFNSEDLLNWSSGVLAVMLTITLTFKHHVQRA